MKSPKAPKLPRPITVDFETEKIVSRPFYPPKPVGVSIKLPGKKAKYYSFGHPTKNNCTREQAVAALNKVWKHKDGLLFQNGKFDVDVAEVHFGLPIPEWDKIHDSMFLLFLDDPHQKELGLKPSSERLLGMPPEEQDAVGEWLMQHQPVEGVKISRSKSSEHYFGAYISYAPGDLVGKYANGDTERTEALFNLLWPKTVERGMLEAYDRERKLMPILLEMERQGVPVDLNRLRHDVKVYNGWRDKVNAWILKRLKAGPDLNLDSGAQLVDAMIIAKVVDIDKMPLTPTGKYQTNKEALLLGVTDKVLLGMLKYRTQLSTCLNTFMQPWLKVAEVSGGLIFTTWNQVKAPKGGDTAGTRTGRLSSTPNFQNVPTTFDAGFQHEEKDPKKAKKLPKLPLVLKGLPPLPQIRGYIIAFKNEVLLGRDFSSQELRMLAHFEDGEMQQAYIDKPDMDFHQYAADLITQITGIQVTRKDAKTIAFSILYGSGLGKLAEGIGSTVDNAKKLKKAYLGTLPGISDIQKDLKNLSKQNLPFRTIGGREYFCEPPKLIKGRMCHFDYRMLNHLIQGSSADQTKDAMIRYHHTKTVGRMLLTVHDELLISAPKKIFTKAMEELKNSMNNTGLDVPMLSDGEMGENWLDMKECA